MGDSSRSTTLDVVKGLEIGWSMRNPSEFVEEAQSDCYPSGLPCIDRKKLNPSGSLSFSQAGMLRD